MGMYGQLHRLRSEDAQRLRQSPQDGFQTMALDFESANRYSVEKSWHGLHFVLTGSSGEGDEPLCYLLDGGEPLAGVDTGYGPPRLLSVEQVLTFANALNGIDEAEFDRRFDLEAMETEQVYPAIWDEEREELLEEYWGYFSGLKQFVAEAARQKMEVLVYLG